MEGKFTHSARAFELLFSMGTENCFSFLCDFFHLPAARDFDGFQFELEMF